MRYVITATTRDAGIVREKTIATIHDIGYTRASADAAIAALIELMRDHLEAGTLGHIRAREDEAQ